MENNILSIIGWTGVWVSLVSWIAFVITFCILNNRRKEIPKDEVKEYETLEKRIDYSKDLLDYIKTYIAQIAILKFRTFKDNHDMSKITRNQLMNLISDIAKYVKDSLNKENIDMSKLLYNEEFFNNFIIESTVIILKDMFEKEIENLDVLL